MTAKVLIIEDNHDNLDLMSYLLRAFGYSPLGATNGEDGIALARSEAPDLILCDISMSPIDGYDVAGRLKADSQTQTIRLVAVTAMAMVGDRESVLAAGFDGYIPKPIDPDLFVAQVEAYMESAKQADVEPNTRWSQEHVSETAGTESTGQASGATILVLDDQERNLSLARSILEPFGYEVVTAKTVDEALQLALDRPPDLFLSDVHLNAESGYAFIQAVKREPDLRQIPFIFITSSDARRPRTRELGYLFGADRYLWRPVEPASVLAEIEACLTAR